MITDVAGSINGYYKQIYLAVKELLKIKNEESSIGIECGADIRIFNNKKSNSSIEVKFYKKQIGLYSPEISKTIYNFYMQTSDDTMLYFNTNTKVPDQNIFLKNDNEFILNKKNGISYILSLLIKHACNKNKENKIKDHLIKLNVSCSKCKKNPCDSCILNFVEKYKHDFPMHFTEIIEINPNVNLEEFCGKLHFIFENQPKDQSISSLKKELKVLIKENYKKWVFNFNDLILESIIHKIAISFFDSTVINSLIKNPEADYIIHKKVSRSDVIEFILSYQTFLNEYEEDVLEKEIFDIIGNSNLDTQRILLKFNQEYEEYLFSTENINQYNYVTIKQYFKNNEIKFRTESDRNDLAERFRLYNKGFGLIAYLMSLKVKEVFVREDVVFIKGVKDEHLSIENNNYYDYEKMSKHINLNKMSENNYFRYMLHEDCSLLESISPSMQPPSIKIDKLEIKISLEEYQLVNNMKDETVDELRVLVSSNRSMLVISSITIDRKPLLNALISSIPKNKSITTICEDLLSLPSACIGGNVTYLDSLKNSNYKEQLKQISGTFSLYDKCISLIDNYTLDEKSILDNFKIISKESKSLIGALNRDASYYRDCKNFEEICDNLTFGNNNKFDMFDSFILLEHHFVDGKKQDVVNIFNSQKTIQ